MHDKVVYNMTIREQSMCQVCLVHAHSLFIQHQKVTLDGWEIYLTA